MTILLTVALATSASPALAQTALSQEVPLTVWTAQPAAAFDAIGSWLATANDPAAGPGQAPPNYDYWHEFLFLNTESYGHVSLEIFGGNKYATLFISDEEEGRTHRVGVAFPWQAGRFYFPLVYRVGDGIWGAWIYDNSAASWTFVGALLVPARLGKLESTSATGLAWEGPDVGDCAAYPKADVVRMAPVGFVGSIPVATHLAERTENPGDCPASVSESAFDWDRYVAGVDAAPSLFGAGAPPPSSPVERADRRFMG